MDYIELHAHSNFSLLDGACFPEELVEAACACGMGALALTDHDGLYGVPPFFRAAREKGLKAIVGAELTLDGGCHLTLLVRDPKGYANLCRLITKAQLSGSKGEPRLPLSSVGELSEGLICLSGCKKGEIPGLLLQGRKEEAERAIEKYCSLFSPGAFYLELQHHLDPEDTRLCRQLADLAKKTGVLLVATNNVHYGERHGARLHDVLTCIRNRVSLDDSTPFRRPNSEYFLKSKEEMLLLPALPREALRQTLVIAEVCDFELDFSSYCFPDFPLPEGETAPMALKKLCYERAPRKYRELSGEVVSRVEEELALIEEKKMCGYFLIVWDIMEFARARGILSQGRGSAASSIVAYVLGITPVDPIRHGLFVGRFLNESSAVPDIDIDIDTQRREEVIQYVYEKYGEEHAAMVCTYVTFRARNAIREVGKVFAFPPHILDRMAKSVSSYSPAHVINELKDVAEFRQYLDSAAWEHFCGLSREIVDFPRHLSIHVGGMIVSSKPISEMVPLERARAEGRVVCQWDKDGVDDAGLIKVDLLGLRMLSLIDEAVRLVKATEGKELDLESLPEDDPPVYDLIGRADTIGVFQVESRAQMQSLPRVRPRSLEDLGIEVAIIRPGPLQGDMVHPYMRRRNAEERVSHLHPLLEPILRETLGVILFQEQVLQVAMAIAGFSAGEANRLRKTMGRKNGKAEMAKWLDAFVQGAAKKNIEKGLAEKIFGLIGGFAEFGFCKSHAMSFALLCFRSAFLKLYYPAEFYCALLNNQPMGFYIPEVVVGDARRHGIEVLPVDIEKSEWACSIEQRNAVRLGLRYVKDLGEEGASRIVAERQKGPFRSFKDFCGRTGLDREALKSLVVVGAFDNIERSRRRLLWALRSIDIGKPHGMDLDTTEKVRLIDMNKREELIAAYTIQGFSASSHLLALYRDRLARQGVIKTSQLAARVSGAHVAIGGYNICLQMPPTAKGFAFITLEDEEGLANVVLKPDTYRAYRTLVRLEPLLVVEGTVEKKDGVINVIAKRLAALGRAV
jgi:error-prone DNA polymerase